MGTLQNQTREYAAFISYAHADEAMAARLHKALETYPVPKHLRAQGKTTKPVFRDVAELTAAHSLSEKIRDAVKGSRVLIVLCSPAAKASRWVNEEIRLFRELHGDAAILSAIIEGTPETAFPAALVEGGREPLAAALSSERSGFKLGVTQLAAGMLGTGLDDLIQRGAKRRNRIMGAGLAASLALSGVMGFTAFQAVEARNEAQTARAEAEGLVEYMIKDLKFKLEPVGRLDLLQGIGDKAVEYYDKQDIKNLPDDSLTRQAAARQVLAQVHMDAGRMEDAQREIEAAAALTREVLARNPDDTDAIYAHAQSEFWVGQYYRKQGKLAEMETPWREYDRLAQVLYQKDPTNFDWVMEAAWGKNNLAMVAREYRQKIKAESAIANYQQAIDLFEQAISLKPNSKLVLSERANSMAGKANLILATESGKVAREYKLNHLQEVRKLVARYPADVELKLDLYVSEMDYYNGYFLQHDFEQALHVTETLDSLLSYVKYDDLNTANMWAFVNAVLNGVESFKTDELNVRKEQIRTLLENSPTESEQYKTYVRSMLDIMNIKADYLTNASGDENLTLVELNAKYLYDDHETAANWRLFYAISIRNKELGNEAMAKLFAQRFLTSVNSLSDLEYPTILSQKIIAHNILEQCEQIYPLVRNLTTRGYELPVRFKSLACEYD